MEEQIEVTWWEWCRLCARSSGNIDLTSDSKYANISTAIGKYFWVNIKACDLTQYICRDCFSLVNSLINFTERINKVQAMFLMLQNTPHLDPYEVRAQFDLLDEDWEHIIKNDADDINEDDEQFHEDSNDNTLNKGVEEIHQEPNEFIEEEHIEEYVHTAENEHEEIDLNEHNIGYDSNEVLVVNKDLNTSKIQDDTEVLQSNKRNACEVEKNNSPVNVTKVQKIENQYNFLQTKSIENSSDMSIKNAGTRNISRYTCSACGKTYKNATSYRKHIESHNLKSDLPEFICEECGKVLPTENQLTQHKRIHLPLELKLKVPCPNCEKKFVNEAVMKQHILHVHENAKSYVCEECGVKLKRLASFNDHKLTHSTFCAFQCEYCEKSFKNKARLKAHIETHTDTTYQCSQCDMKLNSKRTLKMHMLVHSEEKGYKCNFCGAEFKRGKALKNHLIAHIGLRPYNCNFCEKTFTNGSNCRAHKKKVHPHELAAEEAAGLKNEPTNVPNIEELRASESVQTPRPANRSGITSQMRALLVAAEQLEINTFKETSSVPKVLNKRFRHFKLNDSSVIQEIVEAEVKSDSQFFVQDIENETVVFEVVDEVDEADLS